MESNGILVTGIGGPAGRSAASYFRDRGLSVIGTDIREVDSVVDSFYIIPRADDSSFSQQLLDIIKKEKPSLLVPTVTEELPIISRLKKVIECYGCLVFISPPPAVDIANDKLKTAMVMAGHNINIPASFDECTQRELIMKEIGFPILSKPRFGRGGRGVTLYHRSEELLAAERTGLVFQEFIPGEEFDVNLFIDRSGDVLADVVLKKTLLKQGIVGNAIEVERVERKDIARFGVQVAQALKLEGPADMDIRLRSDGTPVLLEINARLGGNVLFAKEVLDSLLISWWMEVRELARL